jgi:hypothetical protein
VCGSNASSVAIGWLIGGWFVDWLVPGVDMDYMKTFITTYRSFTSTSELLRKLLQRYNVPESHNQFELPIQLRICNVLRRWVDLQYREFNTAVVEQIEQFASVLAENKSYKQFATSVRQTLEKIGEEAQMTKNDIVNLHDGPRTPMRPANLLFVFDEEEVARQLTLVDNAIYNAIRVCCFSLSLSLSLSLSRLRAPNHVCSTTLILTDQLAR